MEKNSSKLWITLIKSQNLGLLFIIILLMKLPVIELMSGDAMEFVEINNLFMATSRDQWIENHNQQIHGGKSINDIVEDNSLKLVNHKRIILKTIILKTIRIVSL